MYTVLLYQDQVQVACGRDEIGNKCLSNLGRKSLPMIGHLEHIESRRKTVLILIFFNCLTLEDGTNSLFRNVDNKITALTEKFIVVNKVKPLLKSKYQQIIKIKLMSGWRKIY
jgi:hypothetical protein